MADPSPPAPDLRAKADLRAHMRAARRAFVGMLGPGRVRAEDDACRLLLPLLGQARCVAFYRGREAEIAPEEAMNALIDAGGSVALPRLGLADDRMTFRCWHRGEPLHPGPHRVDEPGADAPIATPDVIIVPLVAFDRSGARLGQGGGLYDRALAANPDAYRIGFAWSVQEVDRVPADPWDVALDAVVTERERIECL